MLRHVALVGLVALPAHAFEPTRARSGCPAGMVAVPGGTFTMGGADEGPQHQVTLSGFCIDRTEVTQAAYRACVTAGACAPSSSTIHWPDIEDADRDFWSPWCHGARADRDRYPVNCIDWDMARTYCEWAGKRLPTEAEWEYAARGGDGRRYPWGDDAPTPDHLNACGTECVVGDAHNTEQTFDASDGFQSTAPVGSFPRGASPFGALDMAGNVWEWVADWHGPYSAAAARNPRGPARGTERGIRGGGFSGDVDGSYVTAIRRGGMDGSFRSSSGGVRCARDD